MTITIPSTDTVCGPLLQQLAQKVENLAESGMSRYPDWSWNPSASKALLHTINDASVSLNGTDPNRLYARLAAWLRTDGWNVQRGTFDDETRGETRPPTRDVVILESLDDASAAAVLAHEAAHITLGHPDDWFTHTMFPEVQESAAEATAYLVGSLNGLDTSDLSVGYIAGWAGPNYRDMFGLIADDVTRAAATISRAIDAQKGI